MACCANNLEHVQRQLSGSPSFQSFSLDFPVCLRVAALIMPQDGAHSASAAYSYTDAF
jgi:hypothetical protein